MQFQSRQRLDLLDEYLSIRPSNENHRNNDNLILCVFLHHFLLLLLIPLWHLESSFNLAPGCASIQALLFLNHTSCSKKHQRGEDYQTIQWISVLNWEGGREWGEVGRGVGEWTYLSGENVNTAICVFQTDRNKVELFTLAFSSFLKGRLVRFPLNKDLYNSDSIITCLLQQLINSTLPHDTPHPITLC